MDESTLTGLKYVDHVANHWQTLIRTDCSTCVTRVLRVVPKYATVFVTDYQPRQPALQTYWLEIHVLTTGLAQGILAVSFGAGVIYLLRTIDLKGKKMTKRTFGVEFIMYTFMTLFAFIVLTNVFNAFGYEAQFSYINEFEEPASI